MIEISPRWPGDAAAFGLTTARIIYHRPDDYDLLQEFLWQHEDVFPEFPKLRKFLDFWEREIEGPLHEVTVAHSRLIRPAEIAGLGPGFRLN